MDLRDSGAREFSVSLENKVRNKQAHQYLSSVSLVSCKCVKNGSLSPYNFFSDTTTTTFAGTGIGNIPWLPNNSFTTRERERFLSKIT